MRPWPEAKTTIVMIRLREPAAIRTQPTTLISRPATVALTAKVRIAPIARRKMPEPIRIAG
jgi:hypothetical protein